NSAPFARNSFTVASMSSHMIAIECCRGCSLSNGLAVASASCRVLQRKSNARSTRHSFALLQESLSYYLLQPIRPKNPDVKTATPVPMTLLRLLEEEPLHSRKLISGLFSQPQHGNISFPYDIR